MACQAFPSYANPTNPTWLLNAVSAPELRIPKFSMCFPKTFKILVEQCLECRLEEPANESKAHWLQKLWQMYSKQRLLFEVVNRNAQNMRGGTRREKLMTAAAEIDAVWGNAKITKYQQQLKDSDPATKCWNCKWLIISCHPSVFDLW